MPSVNLEPPVPQRVDRWSLGYQTLAAAPATWTRAPKQLMQRIFVRIHKLYKFKEKKRQNAVKNDKNKIIYFSNPRRPWGKKHGFRHHSFSLFHWMRPTQLMLNPEGSTSPGHWGILRPTQLRRGIQFAWWRRNFIQKMHQNMFGNHWRAEVLLLVWVGHLLLRCVYMTDWTCIPCIP